MSSPPKAGVRLSIKCAANIWSYARRYAAGWIITQSAHPQLALGAKFFLANFHYFCLTAWRHEYFVVNPELISIPGGLFLMGSENGPDDERPVHEVFLSPFQIGRFAITNREFREFAFNHSHLEFPETKFNDPDQPVTSVSWLDAVAYCEWLQRQSGKAFRLPTEAEWEFAACAGDPGNIYPWGTRTWNERPELHNRFLNGPEPVGSFEPNEFGIHDMGMNVHEWCSDWYDRAYYSSSPSENPKGPLHGTRRSSRGGSWRHQIKITRCAARSSIPPGMRYADYGFRVAI